MVVVYHSEALYVIFDLSSCVAIFFGGFGVFLDLWRLLNYSSSVVNDSPAELLASDVSKQIVLAISQIEAQLGFKCITAIKLKWRPWWLNRFNWLLFLFRFWLCWLVRKNKASSSPTLLLGRGENLRLLVGAHSGTRHARWGCRRRDFIFQLLTVWRLLYIVQVLPLGVWRSWSNLLPVWI